MKQLKIIIKTVYDYNGSLEFITLVPETMHITKGTIMESSKSKVSTQIVDVSDYTMNGIWRNLGQLNKQMNQVVDTPKLPNRSHSEFIPKIDERWTN